MQSNVRDAGVEEGEIDVRRFFGIVYDNRWLIAGFTAFFLLLSTLYVIFGTPIYEANALVQVEPQAASLESLSDLTQQLGNPDSQSVTEIDIIQSRQVLGEAIDQENLTIVVEPLGLWGLPLFSPNHASDVVLSSMSVPDELETRGIDLLVGAGGTFSLSYDGSLLGNGQVGKELIADNGELKLMVDKITAPVGSRFELFHMPRQMAYLQLFKELDVEEVGKTSGIIQLTLDGPSKSKTVSIVQSVANAYVEQNVRRRAEEASKSLDFLRAQLPKVKSDLYKSEDALNSFRLQRGSLDMDLEAKAVLEQSSLLQQQLSDLSVQQAAMGHMYSPQHPAYKALLDERAAVERQQESLKQRVADLPDSQQKLLRLSRDVEVNEQLYLQMFEKIQELDVARAGTVGNVRILDQADAQWKPVKPRTVLVTLLAIVLGLFIGTSVAIARDLLNPGVESVEELEGVGMAVLAVVPFSDDQLDAERDQLRRLKARSGKGTIPDVRAPQYLLSVVKPEDMAIESLRSLRTSLHFSLLDARNRVVMMSGPSPRVGKSFISANFGVVLAQSGQRVLIIDADMRRGSLHKLFGLPPHEGLSEFLMGKLSREAVVKKSSIMGLDVIGRGMAPGSPAELLMTQRMTDLVEWANGQYDIVLIDTPPVLAVTDAAIVGRLAGITMIVVRHRANSVREIQLTTRRFLQNGVVVNGYLLNGVRREAGYGYYNYGYYNYKYESVRSDDSEPV